MPHKGLGLTPDEILLERVVYIVNFRSSSIASEFRLAVAAVQTGEAVGSCLPHVLKSLGVKIDGAETRLPPSQRQTTQSSMWI